MRSKAAAIALAVAFCTTLTSAAVFLPQEASAQSRRGYDMFYNDLAQDGRWVEHPRYGWVWYPTRVRDDWRPYSDGQWRWTDRHGWYWDSNERFGWATYHYGRWGYDDQYGHIWVPGDEWAPAWVSFRDSDDHIGWAPLPPETLGMTLLALLAGGRSGSYYRYVDMSDSYYQPRWTFVPTRHFTDYRVYTHAYSWRDNDRYYRSSRNVTNYITVNNYYVNRSIDPHRWESRTGRQLQTVNVREASSHDQWRQDRDRRDERNISVYNPRIERDRDGRSAPPAAVRATANDKPVVRVQREWTAPEERRDRPNTRDEWRQRITQGDRDGNDRDRNDRDRTGRPDTTTPGGATPATPATRATPADPGVNPATRATPATPATPPDRSARPGRDRDDSDRTDRDGNDRDRNGRPDTATPGGATPATPATRATPADPGVNPATRATPATPATPPDRGIRQGRDRDDNDRNERAQQQRAEQERAQQQRAQQQREQQREQQEKIQQQRSQQQERVQQQRQQQQEKVQQQRSEQPERAQRARQPEQAAKPERQPEQRQQQQPQRGKQERGGDNDCKPNQPNCR